MSGQYKEIKVIEVYTFHKKYEEEVNELLSKGFEIITASIGHLNDEEPNPYYQAIMGQPICEIIAVGDIDFSRNVRNYPVIFDEITPVTKEEVAKCREPQATNKQPFCVDFNKTKEFYQKLGMNTFNWIKENDFPLNEQNTHESGVIASERQENTVNNTKRGGITHQAEQWRLQNTNVQDLKCSEKLRNILRHLLQMYGVKEFKNIFYLYTRAEIKEWRGLGPITFNELEELREKAGLNYKQQ